MPQDVFLTLTTGVHTTVGGACYTGRVTGSSDSGVLCRFENVHTVLPKPARPRPGMAFISAQVAFSVSLLTWVLIGCGAQDWDPRSHPCPGRRSSSEPQGQPWKLATEANRLFQNVVFAGCFRIRRNLTMMRMWRARSSCPNTSLSFPQMRRRRIQGNVSLEVQTGWRWDSGHPGPFGEMGLWPLCLFFS